jgi:hypothetical protein
MQSVLFQKYHASIDIYNVKIINEIVFNSPVKITSVFKDYLVNDEIAGFIDRYYPLQQAHSKIRILTEFFNSYYKVYPSYIAIKERKFMYK